MPKEPTGPVELSEYRHKAKAWLAENIPRIERRDPHEDDQPTSERVEECKLLQNRLFEGGYAGITFPTEYGGQGLSIEHESVFLEEAVGFDIPIAFFGVSINILGATLNAYGNHVQKATHLPNILSGKQRWLQLLSEPSGGSDIAGVLTSATHDGDCFVINGQKIWSTGAHLSDFALCPVRTRWDVPKHKGISVFIVDLKTPGIEVHRIKEISGSARFCQEYLTDVVVPAGNLVGEENEGWRVIRGLLEIEHAWVGRGGSSSGESQGVSELVSMVKSSRRRDDAGVRRKVTDLHVALRSPETNGGTYHQRHRCRQDGAQLREPPQVGKCFPHPISRRSRSDRGRGSGRRLETRRRRCGPNGPRPSWRAGAARSLAERTRYRRTM